MRLTRRSIQGLNPTMSFIFFICRKGHHITFSHGFEEIFRIVHDQTYNQSHILSVAVLPLMFTVVRLGIVDGVTF